MKDNREPASFIAPPGLFYHEGFQIATSHCERRHSILLMRLVYYIVDESDGLAQTLNGIDLKR